MPRPPHRPLLAPALAALSGVALGPWLPYPTLLALAAASALVALRVVPARAGAAGRAGTAACLVAAAALSGARAHQVQRRAAAAASSPIPSGPRWLQGEALREPTRTPFGDWATRLRLPSGAVVEAWTPRGGFDPGARLRLEGRFQELASTREPHHPDPRLALATRGAAARFLATRVQVLAPGRGPAALLAAARRHARSLIRRGVRPAHRPLFRTVLLGDPPRLDPALRDAFRRSGTAHLLSLSGLHVGLLAALVGGLGALLALPRRQRAWLVAAALLLYLGVAGPRVPTLRATLAGLVLCSAPTRGDAWNRLAGAAWAVLLWDPTALWSLGFQLSFGTVAGLLALVPALQGLNVPRPARRTTITALAAFLAATPLLGVTLGLLPLASLLAGAPAVAVFTLCLALGLLGLGLGALLPGPGVALLGLADRCAAPLVSLVQAAAALDLQLRVLPPRPPAAILVAGILALAAVRREAGRSHRVLLGLGLLGLLALLTPHPGPAAPRLLVRNRGRTVFLLRGQQVLGLGRRSQAAWVARTLREAGASRCVRWLDPDGPTRGEARLQRQGPLRTLWLGARPVLVRVDSGPRLRQALARVPRGVAVVQLAASLPPARRREVLQRLQPQLLLEGTQPADVELTPAGALRHARP